MRLICPNCGAQYEVADDVIPQDGRDVQCSSCAHTWFENRGASEAEEELAPVTPAPVVHTDADIEDEEDAQWGAEDYAPKPAVEEKPAPKRQTLDPAIADILREEAAREAAARRAEAVESQPDLGLDSADAAPDQRTAEAQARMAERKGEPVAAPAAASRAAIAAASRGDLLPDIEEINSSLRSESERGTGYAEPMDEPKVRKRGARAGFIIVLLILALLAAIYIFAPKIREMVPAVDGPLTTYVETVDKGRLWLDAQLRRAVDAMSNDDAAVAPVDETPEAAPAISTDAPEMAPVTE